jgi:hypothetical protein
VEVTPILNVSDLRASFEWFAKLGWEKGWDWCPPDADSPTSAPENKPWNVREMHVRHPDGHVLRVSSEATHEHQ